MVLSNYSDYIIYPSPYYLGQVDFPHSYSTNTRTTVPHYHLLHSINYCLVHVLYFQIAEWHPIALIVSIILPNSLFVHSDYHWAVLGGHFNSLYVINQHDFRQYRANYTLQNYPYYYYQFLILIIIVLPILSSTFPAPFHSQNSSTQTTAPMHTWGPVSPSHTRPGTCASSSPHPACY